MNSSPAGRSFNQSARSRDRSVAFPVRRKGGHEGRIASLNGGSVTPLGKAVITPMTVHNFNNNSNHVDAKSNWQGNRLQCNILEHVNDNALTTGNDLKCNNVNNYYITESSKACNRGNTGAVSNTRISKSSGSNSSRSALTHKRDKKMASHGNEYSTNTGRRMKVQPVGDDQFILTVEDTGISPAILHQQMKDQRVRLPQSQQMSRQQRLYPPNVTPHWTQSYSGGSSSQPFSGQPFMVAMSEGGLPRINMLSTPWLSNTLPHQKVPWTPPQDSELLPVSVSQHQNTFPRVEAADNIDIPVYKIIGNEAVPVRSAVSLPEPPALPPRRSKVRNGSQAESARPVTDSWSLTLPSKSRLASGAPGELEWVGRYHGSPHSVWPTGLDTSSLRQRGMKINAPAAIDVKQVPAAGQSKALVPSSSPNTFNTLPSRKYTNRQEPITSINIQRIDKEVDDMPVFKISTNSPNSASSAANSPNSASSAANSPFPTTSDYDDGNTHLKTNETHPNVLHSTKLAGKSNSSKDTRRKSQRNTRRPETQPAVRLENSDQPPAEKSPSGYLQTYLREVRSPSPSRRKASRERGRQRASRSSSRGRDKNGRFRSPSPMPERCREIIFNDEIDWSNVRAPTPRQIDWDQIAAVLR
ncbi:hypothetical protein EB796_006296 [Bugula neritina]|uniref:Uncharacterized protein n=1 Tax=Bugula neritina TaxID=10212 RepID=A0A7J7KBR4_BUGNE|nr:hypothetical protein EB796_006296 [Bugula neritina]